MTELDEPLPPPDEADVSRLLARYRTTDPAAGTDTGPSAEHVAEAWRDALDETLNDVVESELERDVRG